MEVKKSPKANLERGKTFSLLMGLVLSLSVVFVALEWRSSNASEGGAVDKIDVADMEDALFIPDTQQPPPPEPETPVQETVEVQLPEEFKVVDNEKEVAKIALVSADEKRPLPPPAPVVTAPAPVVEEEEQIFEIVEEEPVPPGGSQEALLKWVARSIVYPEIAADNGVQGRVIVQFVVERDGSISKATVVRGVDPSLDKEALRVVNKMDKWKPGKQRGKAVRVKYTLPIQFKLQ